MAGPYSDLTDEELLAEIVEYRTAYKQLSLGGDVAVIAGEGRRLEYTRASTVSIETALTELLAERNRRPSLGGNSYGTGTALGVDIY